MSRMRGCWCLVALFGLLGCKGGEDDEQASRCEQLCQSVDARCGTSDLQDCTTTLCGLVTPPAGCLDAVETAACTDLEQLTGSWLDVCFPPCDERGATCDDDRVTQCTDEITGDLRRVVTDCVDACEDADRTYSGTCDDNYGSQQSQTGFDICWCE